jgi:hypothetical protein
LIRSLIILSLIGKSDPIDAIEAVGRVGQWLDCGFSAL